MVAGRILSISLARMAFTDAQLKSLRKLAALEKLNLDGTDISDLGLKTVGRLVNLRDRL